MLAEDMLDDVREIAGHRGDQPVGEMVEWNWKHRWERVRERPELVSMMILFPGDVFESVYELVKDRVGHPGTAGRQSWINTHNQLFMTFYVLATEMVGRDTALVFNVKQNTISRIFLGTIKAICPAQGKVSVDGKWIWWNHLSHQVHQVHSTQRPVEP